MTRNDGLWIFVAVVAGNVAGLLVDYLLMRGDLPMVTDIAQRNRWFAILLIVVQLIGVAGLAYHFFGRNGR